MATRLASFFPIFSTLGPLTLRTAFLAKVVQHPLIKSLPIRHGRQRRQVLRLGAGDTRPLPFLGGQERRLELAPVGIFQPPCALVAPSAHRSRRVRLRTEDRPFRPRLARDTEVFSTAAEAQPRFLLARLTTPPSLQPALIIISQAPAAEAIIENSKASDDRENRGKA